MCSGKVHNLWGLLSPAGMATWQNADIKTARPLLLRSVRQTALKESPEHDGGLHKVQSSIAPTGLR